jgi:hypothetical protein
VIDPVRGKKQRHCGGIYPGDFTAQNLTEQPTDLQRGRLGGPNDRMADGAQPLCQQVALAGAAGAVGALQGDKQPASRGRQGLRQGCV